MNILFGRRAVTWAEAPVLFLLLSLLFVPICFALSKAAMTLQAWCLLAPGERFPLTWEGALYEVPEYAANYVRLSTNALTFFTWFFLAGFFGGYYVTLRCVTFAAQKFLLWWGIGLGIGALAGLGAYNGQLERFLDTYLPFIWHAKPILEPGDTYQTFLPPRPADAFAELAGIALQVGLLANTAWFVLRWLFYRLRGEVAALNEEKRPFKLALIGVGIREEN